MPAPHPQSLREELANTASHGAGVLLALLAMPVLAAEHALRDPLQHLGVWVFGASMLLLYGVSSAYHAAPVGRTKAWLRRMDHAAIYIFMAGSFTPFALGTSQGRSLLVVVWAVALIGVALKLTHRLRNTVLSTLMYLAFGWLVLWAAQPLLGSVSNDGVLWLWVGGLTYTAGTAFFLLEGRLRFSHLVWHLFVLAGSGCHVVAVFKHMS